MGDDCEAEMRYWRMYFGEDLYGWRVEGGGWNKAVLHFGSVRWG